MDCVGRQGRGALRLAYACVSPDEASGPGRWLQICRFAELVNSQRFDEAERAYDRAIALRPENLGPYTLKAVIYLVRDGISPARDDSSDRLPSMWIPWS
jgi:hypothetical protein